MANRGIISYKKSYFRKNFFNLENKILETELLWSDNR